MYYPVTAVIASKSYANTILVVLNNRINIIGGRNEISPGDHTVSSDWRAHRVGLPWRLRKKETKEAPERPGRSGDGITVVTEVWSDAPNLNILEIVGPLNLLFSIRNLTHTQSTVQSKGGTINPEVR